MRKKPSIDVGKIFYVSCFLFLATLDLSTGKTNIPKRWCGPRSKPYWKSNGRRYYCVCHWSGSGGADVATQFEQKRYKHSNLGGTARFDLGWTIPTYWKLTLLRA